MQEVVNLVQMGGITQNAADLINKIYRTKKLPANASEDFKNAIDWFNKSATERLELEKAVQNVMIRAAYKINNAVENIVAANRPVDMNKPQAAAQKSSKQLPSLQLTQDNALFISQMTYENQTGKSCVGIAAVGLKVFFAVSHVQNQRVLELEELLNDTTEGKELGADWFALTSSLIDSARQELVDIASAVAAVHEDMTNEQIATLEFEEAEAKRKYRDVLKSAADAFEKYMNSTVNYYTIKDNNGQPITYITNLIGNINFDSSPRVNQLYNYYLEYLRQYADEHIKGPVKVVDVRDIDDVATSVISAMVSSATDNAKELILAKINAGKDFMGTYMTALMYGVDFGDFANFMISPNIDKIVHMSMPNIFTGKKNTITSAIRQAQYGPEYSNYFNNRDRQQMFRYLYEHREATDFMANMISSHFEFSPILKELITDKKGEISHKWIFQLGKIFREMSRFPDQAKYILETVDYLEKLPMFTKVWDYIDWESGNNYINPFDSRQTHVYRQAARYFRDVRAWANDVVNTPNYMNDVNAFEKFYKLSKETEILGRRLSINQGFKVDLYGQYSYNRQLTKYIYDKLEELHKDPIGFTEGYDDYRKELYDFCMFAGIKRSDNIDITPGEELDALDVARWNDPDPEIRQHYRRFINNTMKIVTNKVDPIDIATNHPSYNAMIETENFAINMFGGSVVRYNQVLDIAKKLYDDIGWRDLTDKEFGTISRFVMDSFIQRFFDNSTKSFIVPKGGIIYEYEGRGKYTTREATEDTPVKLNTAAGRITFKALMDARLSYYKSYSKNNEFLSSLCTDDKIDQVTGKKYSYLRVDMDLSNIKTVQEEARYQDMVNSFEVLSSSKSEIGLDNIAEEFMIYNMIVNNNAFGSSYFTKIFESSIRPGDNNILTDLFNYIGTFDYLQDSNKMGKFELESSDLEYLRMALAYTRKAEDYINVDHGNYIKVYDKDFGTFKIYKRMADLESIMEEETGRIPYDKDVYVTEQSVEFDNRIPTFMQLGPVNINEKIAISNLDVETLVNAYSKGLYSINIKC